MGVRPEDCDTIMENVTILQQSHSLAAHNQGQAVAFPDPLTSPASTALMSMSRNAHRGFGGNAAQKPQQQMNPPIEQFPPQAPPYAGGPCSPPYEYPARFSSPGPESTYPYGHVPWGEHGHYSQMRFMGTQPQMNEGWPRMPGPNMAQFTPGMNPGQNVPRPFRNYGPAQDPQQVANDIVNMTSQRYSHQRPLLPQSMTSPPQPSNMRRYRLGTPSISSFPTSGGPPLRTDSSIGYQSSQFCSAENSCASPQSPQVNITSPGSVYSNNSNMFNTTQPQVEPSVSSPMNRGIMSPNMCRMQSPPVHQDFPSKISCIAEKCEVSKPSGILNQSSPTSSAYHMPSHSPYASVPAPVNTHSSYKMTKTSPAQQLNHRPPMSVSQTSTRPSDPLQSLHKLAMFTNSQVVDPKSVVHDACFSGGTVGDERCDESGAVEQKNCCNGSSAAIKTVLPPPLIPDRAFQQSVNAFPQPIDSPFCKFGKPEVDICEINFGSCKESNEPNFSPKEFDIEAKIPMIDWDKSNSDNDLFAVLDKCGSPVNNFGDNEDTNDSDKMKALERIKQDLLQINDPFKSNIESENPLISELLCDETELKSKKVSSPNSSPLKRESNVVKKEKTKKKKMQNDEIISTDGIQKNSQNIELPKNFQMNNRNTSFQNSFETTFHMAQNQQESVVKASKGSSRENNKFVNTDSSRTTEVKSEIAVSLANINQECNAKASPYKADDNEHNSSDLILNSPVKTDHALGSETSSEKEYLSPESDKQNKIALDIRRRRRVRNFLTPKGNVTKTTSISETHNSFPKGDFNRNTENMLKIGDFEGSKQPTFNDGHSIKNESENVNCLKDRDSCNLQGEPVQPDSLTEDFKQDMSMNNDQNTTVLVGLLAKNLTKCTDFPSSENCFPQSMCFNDFAYLPGSNHTFDSHINGIMPAANLVTGSVVTTHQVNASSLDLNATNSYSVSASRHFVQDFIHERLSLDSQSLDLEMCSPETDIIDNRNCSVSVTVGLPDMNGNTVNTRQHYLYTQLKCKPDLDGSLLGQQDFSFIQNSGISNSIKSILMKIILDKNNLHKNQCMLAQKQVKKILEEKTSSINIDKLDERKDPLKAWSKAKVIKLINSNKIVAAKRKKRSKHEKENIFSLKKLYGDISVDDIYENMNAIPRSRLRQSFHRKLPTVPHLPINKHCFHQQIERICRSMLSEENNKSSFLKSHRNELDEIIGQKHDYMKGYVKELYQDIGRFVFQKDIVVMPVVETQVSGGENSNKSTQGPSRKATSPQNKTPENSKGSNSQKATSPSKRNSSSVSESNSTKRTTISSTGINNGCSETVSNGCIEKAMAESSVIVSDESSGDCCIVEETEIETKPQVNELGFKIVLNDEHERKGSSSSKDMVRVEDVKTKTKHVEIPLEIISIVKNNGNRSSFLDISDIKSEDVLETTGDVSMNVSDAKNNTSKAKKKNIKKRKRKSEQWEEESDNEESFKMLNLSRTFDLFKTGKIKKPKLDVKKSSDKKNCSSSSKLTKTKEEVTKPTGPLLRIKGSLDTPVSCRVINVSETDTDKGRDRTVISNQVAYDLDPSIPFVCAICGQSSSTAELGDLFGPYYSKNLVKKVETKDCLESPVKAPKLTPKISAKSLPQRNKKKSIDESEWVVESTKKSNKLTPTSTTPGKKSVSVSTPESKKRKAKLSKSCNVAESSAASDKPKSPTKQAPGKRNISSPKLSGSTQTAGDKGTEVWVHEDCLVWTSGVYIVGHQIHGIEEALAVSQSNPCSVCKKVGATLGCFTKGCGQKFHFVCARDTGCYLEEDTFSVYCAKHKVKKIQVKS